MNRANENPPEGNRGANEVAIDAIEASPMLAESPDRIDASAHVAGVYVAVVQVKHGGPQPRYRRRVVMSLATAQRAVDRAHMEDLEAHIVLCKLVPVGGDPA